MDNTGKLALFSVAALAALLVVRRAAAAKPPVKATALERQVMQHRALIWDAGVRYDVDPALIAAIMAAESSGRSQAPRAIHVRDYEGNDRIDYVVGLMQVRVDTAGLYCDLWHRHDLVPHSANVECGTKYLRAMLDRFGKVHLAVSAYNAGAGRVVTETSMVGGMEYVNLAYMRNVLGMIHRFRLLFMGYEGADVYLMLFPSRLWGYEIP